jgi:hypothetical protein
MEMKAMLHRAAAVFVLSGLAFFVGCGSSTMSPTVTAAPQTTTLYAATSAGGTSDTPEVFSFNNPSSLNGNVTPGASLIAGTNPALLSGLAVDAQMDRVYVLGSVASNALAISIFDHASTRTASAVPDRQIVGAATGLIEVAPMVLDTGRDIIYAACGINANGTTNLLVFNNASTTSGNVAPARTLNFASPASQPFSMVLDQANDRLFVSTSSAEIDIYDHISTATSLTPARTISGPLTGLTSSFGITLDGNGRLLVLNDVPANITIYNAATDNGNVAPLATISSPMLNPSSGTMAVDLSAAGGGDLYVATTAGQVLVFTKIGTANGNVAPARTINYPSLWSGTTPLAIATH